MFESHVANALPDAPATLQDSPVQAAVMTITPAYAKELLKRDSVLNRSLRPVTVDQYAAEMKADRWRLNGEGIMIDTNGGLLNGQHRLHACIKAGRPFETLVVCNLDPGTISTMDTGRKRTAASVLQMNRVRNAGTVAAIVKRVFEIERAGETHWHTDAISNQVILEYTERHLAALEKSAIMAVTAKDTLGKAALLGAIHHCGAKRSGEFVANTFLSSLIKGISLEEHNPILTLRNYLIKDKLSKQSYSKRDVSLAAVKAWNAWREGRDMRLMKVTRKERFPSLVS